MVRVFITQVCIPSNKGDQAIFQSEISLLKRIFPRIEISASTLWSEKLFTYIEPDVHFCRPLVDLKIKGKDCPTILCPLLLVIQVLLSAMSIIFLKIHLKAPYRADTLNQFLYADLIISSGHEPFMDGSFRQNKYPIYSRTANLFVLFWGVCDVFVAKKVFRKPFITFPQSVGPFRTFFGRQLASFIFRNLDAILLRENFSEFIKNIETKTPIYLTSDMAFLFEGCSKCNYKLDRPSVGVSPCLPHELSGVRVQTYVSAIAKVLDYLLTKHGISVVFLPSQSERAKAATKEKVPDDLELCLMILQKMIHKDKAEIFKVQTAREFECLVRQLDLLITTRMHPSILASINCVPFVSMVYEHKQKGLLEQLGLENNSVNIDEVSYDVLKSVVDYSWNNRGIIKKQLSLTIPELQKQIRDTLNEVLSKLITIKQ